MRTNMIKMKDRGMKQVMKGLLLVAFLTFSPSHLLTCLADDSSEEVEFPFEGGMTSDSVLIGKAVFESFQKMENMNSCQVQKKVKYATIKFTVTVPEGKEANLQFKSYFKIAAKKGPNDKYPNTYVTLEVKRDNTTAYNRSAKRTLNSKIANVFLPSGKSEITFLATFQGASDFDITGCIDDMFVHVHRYTKTVLMSEPICGKVGKIRSNCDICAKVKLYDVEPEHANHSMKEMPQKKFSCLSNATVASVCEYCPYKEVRISKSADQMDHDFDDNDVCKKCHMRLPRHNADTTVYYVYNAGEMRLLSEMVSLGRISGNIGVDIRSDLVFSRDTTMLPLGTFDHPFHGVLNGNGHRIRGIANAYQGIDCLGFVGVAKGTLLSHAVIANLIFDTGNSLTGMACVGGIVGYATDCDIVNCASFGSLEGTDNIGGLVGYADQHVNILNCASMSTIRTKGKWNTMVCGMPHGHILNSYGAVVNTDTGVFDELPTTTLRHCFSTQASGEGLRKVTEDVLMSYTMVELLNEESESENFMMSAIEPYPIPVVSGTVEAKSNRAFPTTDRRAFQRRAAEPDLEDYELSEKDREELQVFGGYVDEVATESFGQTMEDVMHKDSVEYADFARVYIATRTVPEDAQFQLYQPLSGGDLTAFESYIVPLDSSYTRMIEYEVISSDLVMPKTETVNYSVGDKELVDEYKIDDSGAYTLKARISFEDENNLVYMESVDGIMKPVWSVQTVYDESGNPAYTNAYSHNLRTGENNLEYSYQYNNEGNGEEDETYQEFLDSINNTIHVLFNYTYDTTANESYTDHYILRASDGYPLEVRTEKIVDDEAVLTDGIYFVYDDNNNLVQSVAFAPNGEDGELRPYLYYEYVGAWEGTPYPTTTAIQLPTKDQPSLQKRMDAIVYDMQGRVARKVTDMKDPFSGLSRGFYIYQGKKFLKR